MRDENIPAFIGHLSFSFLAHGHRVPSLNWIITHLGRSIINWDDLDFFYITNMRDCFSVCSSPHSSFNFHRLWAGGADIEAEYVFLLFWTFTQQLMISLFFSPSDEFGCHEIAVLLITRVLLLQNHLLSSLMWRQRRENMAVYIVTTVWHPWSVIVCDSAQPPLNGFPAPLSTLSSR